MMWLEVSVVEEFYWNPLDNQFSIELAVVAIMSIAAITATITVNFCCCLTNWP